MNLTTQMLTALGRGLFCLVLGLALSLPAAEPTPAALTDEECAKFGEDIAAWIVDKEIDKLHQALDPFTFADRLAAGLGYSRTEMDELRSGLRIGLKRSLTNTFEQLEDAKFLRVVTRNNEKRALVRTNANGGINYFEFVCARRASGQPKWVDVFVYFSGELLSKTIRNTIVPVVAASKAGLLERLTSSESEFVKNFPQFIKASGLIKEGKHAQATAILRAMPAELQLNRTVLMLRLRAAQEADPMNEELYLAVISDWEKAYPKDPALGLVSIDGELLRKNFAGAVQRVDALDRQVGGDPYLQLLRANIHVMAENYPAAKKAAELALVGEETDAYDTLLTIAIRQNKLEEIAEYLRRIEIALPDVNMETAIKDMPDYAEFRRSTAYRNWIAEREAAKAKTAASAR